jgi:hypothetical protein
MKHLLLILLMATQSCEEKTDVSFPRPTVTVTKKITEKELHDMWTIHESDDILQDGIPEIIFLNQTGITTDTLYIYKIQ